MGGYARCKILQRGILRSYVSLLLPLIRHSLGERILRGLKKALLYSTPAMKPFSDKAPAESLSASQCHPIPRRLPGLGAPGRALMAQAMFLERSGSRPYCGPWHHAERRRA